MLIAACLSLVITLGFVYIIYGEIVRQYNYTIVLELTFTFLYFLSLFWIYPKISAFIHSPVLQNLKTIYVYLIEGLSVVLATFILTVVVKLFPLWVLLFFVNARFEPENVRRSIIVHAIIALFFYYFVERERIRKRLQAEHLHIARLQKENFQAQLQSLKNQVNPQFLFSSLNALGPLIEKDEEKAVEFVNKLSYVYRSFLDEKEQLVSLQKELELANAYIYLLSVRFGENIQIDLHIPAKKAQLHLPPGSIQALLENTISFNSVTTTETISIKIYTEEDMLVVNFKMLPSAEKKVAAEGLEDIISRYQYLTNRKVVTEGSHKHYLVKLPLLKVDHLPGS